MSDIEELFRGLGDHIDTVDVPPPSVVRRAGAIRLRVRRLTLASILVLACVAASGGVIALVDRLALPAVSPSTGDSWGPLVPLYEVGRGISYGPDGLIGQPRVEMQGNTAFAAWQQGDSTLTIAAMDIRTGEPQWLHREQVPGHWVLLDASGDVLFAIYQSPGGESGLELIAFDSGGGTELWRHRLDNTYLRFGATVVVDDHEDLLGLDIHTGTQRWTVVAGPADATRIVPMRSSLDAGNDSLAAPAGGYRDHLIVVLNVEGRLRFIDTDSGAVARETTIASDGKFKSLVAVDGVAIVGDDTKDLAVTGATPTLVYTAPAGHTLRATTPCGPGRLCVMEDTPQGSDVAVINISTGAESWRAQTSAGPLVSSGAGLYFVSSYSEFLVVDQRGRQLASYHPAVERVLAIDGTDLVLHMRGDLGSLGPTSISFAMGGYTGPATNLGTLEVFGSGCVPDSSTVVCATETGIKVWRFR